MDSLQIRTGQVSLRILDDAGNERGIFTFNPTDIESAKQVLSLQAELEEKDKEFAEKAEQCKTNEEKIDLMDSYVTYYENVIDKIFGPGSSQILFGNNRSLTMFIDFFNGITPYYEKASQKRLDEARAKHKKRSTT